MEISFWQYFSFILKKIGIYIYFIYLASDYILEYYQRAKSFNTRLGEKDKRFEKMLFLPIFSQNDPI